MTTINVICRKQRALKDNKYPLKLRITKDRISSYISLGIAIKLEEWDFERGLPKPSCPEKEYIDKIIADKIAEYRQKAIELKVTNQEFTSTTLLKSRNRLKLRTVGEIFDQQITFLLQQKRTGYALSVKQVKNSLLKYNEHLNMYFSEMNLTWLKRYEHWLRMENLAENTIGIRFRTLRAVYNVAIEEGSANIQDYSFNKYKVSKLHQQTAKRAISKDDIMRVVNFPHKTEYQRLAISLFSFSYYTGGINFVDIGQTAPN